MLGDIFFVLVIAFVVFVNLVIPIINKFRNSIGEKSVKKSAVQDARYNRQVHHMHTKDAETERRHYLDQLKTLYEAGMMEKDEYIERVEAVEADYRGR